MKLIYFLFFLFAGIGTSAQTFSAKDLKVGDLVFQNLDCGPMCDAIEAVTQGIDGQDFSHVALVCKQGNEWGVIEAIGKDVHFTPWDVFSKRTSNKMYVGRLKKQYQSLAKAAVTFCEKQIGTPYDDAFVYNNDKYYCSELIYDAFKYANHGKPFFKLEPMTYKQPHSREYFPVWVDYFQKLKMEIPQGKPGCNPGGLSRSSKIQIAGTL